MDDPGQTQYNLTGLNATQLHTFKIQVISEAGESDVSDRLQLTRSGGPPLPPKGVSVTSSTDSQIVIAWKLDHSLEIFEPTTHWGIFVSIDGTSWPSTPVYTQDVAFVTHTQDCTDTSKLGGQSRSQQFLWFRVAAKSVSGMGTPGRALRRRCSAIPDKPNPPSFQGQTFNWTTMRGTLTIQWIERDLHGAKLIGYKVYEDQGNEADTKGTFSLAATIADPTQRTYTKTGTLRGTRHRFKIVIISEVGDSLPSDASLSNDNSNGCFRAATVPDAPDQPIVVTNTENYIKIRWQKPASHQIRWRR